MNFNASRNVSGPRKAKRVSDVAAMGAPTPAPAFVPGPAYSPGYPAGPPPPYQEGIQLEPTQDFISPAPTNNFGYAGISGFPQSPIPVAQLGSMLQQPIVQDMALQYGNQLAAQGGAAVRRELDKFVPVSRLRYYFAVDTRYVLKKLLLIIFPFTHKDWTVKYEQDTPVQPRYEINAPDLYIPVMGYVTYVLLAGFMLGLQRRFSPEQLGLQASSALAYIACELALYCGALWVGGGAGGGGVRTLELLALAGYKYAVMVGALLAALLGGRLVYRAALAYTSVALSYFLVRTLRLQLLSGSQEPGGAPARSGGTKRRVYFLLFVALTQPLLTWWLTYHLVPTDQPPLHTPPDH